MSPLIGAVARAHGSSIAVAACEWYAARQLQAAARWPRFRRDQQQPKNE